MGEKIRCSPDPANCSYGFLEPNCGNSRTDCGLLSDPSADDPATGAQAMDVQPVHLARSSIQAWLPDELIRRMGAGASARIFAIRHRCYCLCCERASSHPSCRAWTPNPNSNCLALPDAIQSRSVQDSCSGPGSVPLGRSAEIRCCFP